MRLAAFLALLGLAAFAAAQEHNSWDANPGMLRTGGLVLFFGGQGPLSYASATPGGLPKGATAAGEVRGRACQHGLSVPLGLGLRAQRVSAGGGTGGYDRALADIRSRHPELKGVYDVKVDDHRTVVLTIYQRLCTEITARGFQ